MKINVVGTSGSGKSTLSKRLAAVLDVPYIDMDRLFWRPNWQETPDQELLERISDATAASPGWVLDGNYDRTRSVKWQDVDMVVWLDYGFVRTLLQAIRRALWRAWYKIELWPGTGNRESFRRTFFSRESILWWTITTWGRSRQRYLADSVNPRYSHIQFIRLCSPQDADFLVRQLKNGS